MNSSDFAPMVIFTTLLVMGGLVMILRGPLGQAIARRIEGRSGGSALEPRLDDLEARIAQLEGERVEVEQRLEFAERLLSQAREASRELR